MKLCAKVLLLLGSVQILSGCMRIRAVEQSVLDTLTKCNSSTLQGAGTDSNPYKICSASQLAGMNGSTSVFELGRDIDLTNESFAPIPSFGGKLYGKGHSIIGHHYSLPSAAMLGLFKSFDAGTEIHQLTIDSSKIEGRNGIAVLVGSALSSGAPIILDEITIKNSAVSAKRFGAILMARGTNVTITKLKIQSARLVGDDSVGMLTSTGTDLDVDTAQVDGVVNGAFTTGGLVGLVSTSSFKNVAVLANVTIDQDTGQVSNAGNSQNLIGGMFGAVIDTSVLDSYYLGTVVATSDYFEGMAAFAGAAMNTQLTTSYFSPSSMVDLQGNGVDFKGLIGQDYGGNTIDHSYIFNHANVADYSNTAGITPVVAANLGTASSYSSFDFTDIWQLSSGSFTSPSLKTQSASAPFGDVGYLQSSRGPITLSEVEDATGFLFPDTRGDETKYVYLTLSNQSGSTIFLKQAQAALGNSYALATGANSGTCPIYMASNSPLYHNQTCTFGVSFHPNTNIDTVLSDSFVVGYSMVTSSGTVGYLSHKLDGYGIAIVPFLADDVLNFGDGIIAATDLVQDFTLTNSGAGDLQFVSYTSSDPAFIVDSSNCPVGGTLASGNNCDLHISFHPTAVQAYSGTLQVVYQNVLNHQNLTMTLTISGAGVVHPFPGDSSANCLARNGSVAHPFCVTSKADLEKWRDDPATFETKAFEQIANIDMLETGDVSSTNCSINDFGIGILSFQGSYDGGNYTISNLCGTGSAGFIRKLYGTGVVKNLKFSNLQATGPGIHVATDGLTTILGGVVTFMTDNASVDHVTVLSGKVDGSALDTSGASANGESTGGIVGHANGGSITHSSANMSVIGIQRVGIAFGYILGNAGVDEVSTSGTVSAVYNMAGGLGGLANAGTLISNSASTASITSGPVSFGYGTGGLVGCLAGTIGNSFATGSVNGISQMGGLVGFLYAGVIYGSFSTTAVTASSGSVGGLIGWAYGGSVENSFALGSITANVGDNIGGFVGYNQDVTTYTHNYAANSGFSATAAAHKGGFVGADSATSTFTENMFYSGGAAPADTLAAGLSNAGAASYIDAIANYTNFDVPTTWSGRNASPNGTVAKTPVLSWMCGKTLSGVTYTCQ